VFAAVSSRAGRRQTTALPASLFSAADAIPLRLAEFPVSALPSLLHEVVILLAAASSLGAVVVPAGSLLCWQSAAALGFHHVSELGRPSRVWDLSCLFCSCCLLLAYQMNCECEHYRRIHAADDQRHFLQQAFVARAAEVAVQTGQAVQVELQAATQMWQEEPSAKQPMGPHQEPEPVSY